MSWPLANIGTLYVGSWFQVKAVGSWFQVTFCRVLPNMAETTVVRWNKKQNNGWGDWNLYIYYCFEMNTVSNENRVVEDGESSNSNFKIRVDYNRGEQ
jgi:hypothetical protein